MTAIITPEGRKATRGPRRARSTVGNMEWLPFSARAGLHLAVVVVVALSALLGGRLLGSKPADSPKAPVAGAPRLESTPTVEAAALSPLFQSPSVPPIAPLVDRPQPTAVAKVALPAPSREETLRDALSLPLAPQAEVHAAGQEEGVMVVRALAASRGGSRAPEPTPTPSPSPTPEPTPTPPPKKEPLRPQSYKVVAGDTLLRIAARFGITPETILWANSLGNGELLRIGQELTILPVSGVLHKVSRGETMLSIAERYVAEPGKIVDANVLQNPDQVQEGQLLVIPGGIMRTVAVAGLPSAPSQQELAAAPRYTVKQGDTLVSIADAFGVRPSAIQVANGLLNPDLLKIGLQLTIPGGRQPSAPARPQQAAPGPAPAPAPAPVPEAPAPTGSGGDQIAAIALKYLGYRYVWGGSTPAGFDCSGFTMYVYKQAGISIPRDLGGQLGAGPRVSRDKLVPGDLVFFQNTYKPGLSHSGVYLGGGRFIQAEDESSGVQIRSLSDGFWGVRFYGASRPW